MSRREPLRLPLGFRLTFGRRFMRPESDHWPGLWYAQALGVCIFRDTTRPQSVAERGAW